MSEKLKQSSDLHTQAWADYRARFNNPDPDEECTHLAEEALHWLADHASDEYNEYVNRFNLGSFFYDIDEFALASEQFCRMLLSSESESLGIVMAAKCHLHPESPVYDPDRAWKLALKAIEKDNSLRAWLIPLRILTQIDPNEERLELAWDIIDKQYPRALDQYEFCNQPYPEYTAALCWMLQGSGYRVFRGIDLPEAIDHAIDLMNERQSSSRLNQEERFTLRVLHALRDDLEKLPVPSQDPDQSGRQDS